MLKAACLLFIAAAISSSQMASERWGGVSVKDFGAKGDGSTDDFPAISRALASAHGKAQRLLFPAGTYGVSQTIVIPHETQFVGVGRGDPGGANTVIKALPGFPRGGTVVEMGTPPGPNFGVQIENMSIHGASIAGVCLANHYSQEQSLGRRLLLAECTSAGLVVSGGAAQNSGPFEDLEILPPPNASTTSTTRCVEVSGVGAFRGIRGLTCNAGSLYSSRPSVAMVIDGTGVYQDIHIEHFATAAELGSRTNSADGIVFVDGQFGPDVETGLEITAAPGMNNENLTLAGLGCVGCRTLLRDRMTGTHIAGTGLGWYLLGNGPSNRKAIWSSDAATNTQIFSALVLPRMQLMSDGPQPVCSPATRGSFWFVRGVTGAADHLQVCRKSALDSYSWAAVF